MGAFSIPTIPIEATNTSAGSSIDSAASSAQNAAHVSDELVQQVMRNVIPFNGDMGSMVQNRPQVMLPQPIHPKQMGMGEPNQIQATTASGQKRNDISSLISSVGNIVKAGVDKKREKDDQSMMSNLAIIQGASANPDDPHNKAILDKMASDPKVVKQLQKALGYNPLGGEAPPDETKSLMKFGAQSQAKDKAQQIKQAIAQKLGAQAGSGNNPATQGQQQPGSAMNNLMSRMPNMPQLNPLVQIQGELIKAGIMPKADTSLRAFTEFTKQIMTDDAKLKELKVRAEASQNVALINYLRAIETGKAHIEATKMQSDATRYSADQRLAGAKYSADKRLEAAMVGIEKNKGTQTAKYYGDVLKGYETDISAMQVDQNIAIKNKDEKSVERIGKEIEIKKAKKSAVEELVLHQAGAAPSITDELDKTPDTNEMDEEDNIWNDN